MSYFDRRGETPFAKHMAGAADAFVKANRDLASASSRHLEDVLGVRGTDASVPVTKSEDVPACAPSLGCVSNTEAPMPDLLASALGCQSPVTTSKSDDADALIARAWGISS